MRKALFSQSILVIYSMDRENKVSKISFISLYLGIELFWSVTFFSPQFFFFFLHIPFNFFGIK